MNSQKNYFKIALGIFSMAVLGSIFNSILNYDSIVIVFTKLGYPTYLIQLLGVAQAIGLVLIIFNKSHFSLEWAYAGFFMNYSLGAIAHLTTKDGNGASAVICLILLFMTYVQSRKVRELDKQEAINNPELV